MNAALVIAAGLAVVLVVQVVVIIFVVRTYRRADAVWRELVRAELDAEVDPHAPIVMENRE